MRIVITGATGFVGKQLVPLLNETGNDLLLVGRDVKKLNQLFPEFKNCTYETLAINAKGFDLLLHLAVLNNNISANEQAFHKVNVELFAQVVDASKVAGISRLLNFTTFHALDDNKNDAYARSKREALRFAKKVKGLNVVSVFLPTVHGDRYAGKLKFLNNLPKLVAKFIFMFPAALAPTVHVSKLAAFVGDSVMSAVPEDDVLLFSSQNTNQVYRFGKYLIDIFFAVTVIGLFWWLLLLIWLLVRLDSPGPGIFAQERIGKGGSIFTCYKFRTMKLDTPQAGTHEITKESIIKIGYFMRKTKIDELPQVWNILKGEISLIGPRPCLPLQRDLIKERTKRGVLTVAPGISGLAQIKNIDMRDPIRLASCDALYVARQSLFMDVKIILKTVSGGGQGDKTMKSY